MSSSMTVELVPDLVEDREAVVEEVVEDVVEEVARALAEQVVAELGIVRAALEEARHRQQLDRGKGDEVVRAQEDVELAGVQALDCLVVDGEVEDDEAVVVVLVDLRPLPLREDVLDVERVPAEALGQGRRLLLGRRVEVDPGEAVALRAQPARAQRARRPRACRANATGCGAGWASVLSGSSVLMAFAILATRPLRKRLRSP